MPRTTKQVLEEDYESHRSSYPADQVMRVCASVGCYSYPRYVETNTGKKYCPGCATVRASQAADTPHEDTVENEHSSGG